MFQHPIAVWIVLAGILSTRILKLVPAPKISSAFDIVRSKRQLWAWATYCPGINLICTPPPPPTAPPPQLASCLTTASWLITVLVIHRQTLQLDGLQAHIWGSAAICLDRCWRCHPRPRLHRLRRLCWGPRCGSTSRSSPRGGLTLWPCPALCRSELKYTARIRLD